MWLTDELAGPFGYFLWTLTVKRCRRDRTRQREYMTLTVARRKPGGGQQVRVPSATTVIQRTAMLLFTGGALYSGGSWPFLIW